MNRMTIPLGDILTQSGHHRAGNRELPVLSITMKMVWLTNQTNSRSGLPVQTRLNIVLYTRMNLLLGFLLTREFLDSRQNIR